MLPLNLYHQEEFITGNLRTASVVVSTLSYPYNLAIPLDPVIGPEIQPYAAAYLNDLVPNFLRTFTMSRGQTESSALTCRNVGSVGLVVLENKITTENRMPIQHERRLYSYAERENAERTIETEH
ncbi:hypothetical protein J6590_105956 [Homalodisca vitripennis]|nr:hypothetical protein J6590_105956 [Homalodisca vitripennis]